MTEQDEAEISEYSEPPTHGLREIGSLAAWSASSAKPGSGLDCLRDGRTDTYWQSEGVQPHLLNIQYNQRMAVSEVHVLLDVKQDESYTPSRLSFRAGHSHADLKEVKQVEVQEPQGWFRVAVGTHCGDASAHTQANAEGPPLLPLQAFLLQIAVLANHQNGRDCHVRGVRVYGPQTDPLQQLLGLPVAPSNPDFCTHAVIR